MTLSFRFFSANCFNRSAKRRALPMASLALAAALTLAACGGGSNKAPLPGAPTHPGAAPPPDLAVADLADPAVALVASVPAPSYAAGSEELAAFQTLNDVRSACGFGLLAQHVKLDEAARGHADWLIRNGYRSHYQVANTPGFTGVMPAERVAAAGYGGLGTFLSTNLLHSLQGSAAELGEGVVSVMGLLNAPYHGAGLLAGWLDAGVAVRNVADVGVSPAGSRVVVDFDLAHRTATGSQEPAADAVLTYPCEGRTGVDRQLTNETPNPVPGRDLATQPLGSSVIVRLRHGHVLRITQAAMAEAVTGVAVTLRPPVSTEYGNDPHKLFRSHEAYVAAENPLLPRTSYLVSLHGTNDGKAFSRGFRFTTGD